MPVLLNTCSFCALRVGKTGGRCVVTPKTMRSCKDTLLLPWVRVSPLYSTSSEQFDQIAKQMKNLRQRTLNAAILSISTACGLGLQMGAPALAQYTTLTDPYAPGVYVNPPLCPVGYTPPPPVGCGTTPWGVTPGQMGPASLMPWVPTIPANTAGIDSTQLSLPYDASTLTPPGVLGPAMQGAIPPPPSTPGYAPDMLQSPQGASPAATTVQVPSGGVLPDAGAPTARSGRQSTQNFGYHYTDSSYVTDFGLQPSQNPDSAQTPQVSQDGPRQCNYPGQYGCNRNAQPNLPNSSYVSVGTGNHTQFQNNTQARQIIAPY